MSAAAAMPLNQLHSESRSHARRASARPRRHGGAGPTGPRDIEQHPIVPHVVRSVGEVSGGPLIEALWVITWRRTNMGRVAA